MSCTASATLACRKDMLDEALLRPGRLEVQVEIGLPDERGRVQILQVGGRAGGGPSRQAGVGCHRCVVPRACGQGQKAGLSA